MIIKGISELINKHKSSKKLGLENFAALLGVSVKTIQNILDTENVPKTETFVKICELLDLDLNELVRGRLVSGGGVYVVQNVGTTTTIVGDGALERLELALESKEKEIKLLREQVAALSKIINLLEKDRR